MLTIHNLYSETGCGEQLTGNSGTFSSPNYPSPYDHTRTCEWTITVDPGSSITLTIDNIDMENSVQCQFDVLEVTFPYLAFMYFTTRKFCEFQEWLRFVKVSPFQVSIFVMHTNCFPSLRLYVCHKNFWFWNIISSFKRYYTCISFTLYLIGGIWHNPDSPWICIGITVNSWWSVTKFEA